MEPEGTPQTAVDWVIKNSKHKGSAYMVLVMLAQSIDSGNNCPSHKDLAEMTRLSKPTVQHALGELEKDKTIVSIKNGGKEKRGGKTNCYAVAGYNAPAFEDEAAPDAGSDTSDNPVSSDPIGSQPTMSGHPRVSDTPRSETVPGKSAVPHAHESAADTRDAATRVTDLSFRASDLSVKDTPLNPPTTATETIPPDGGRGSTSKPKRERKPAAPVVEDETYRRLLRGVALRSWGVDPDNPALKGLIDRSDFKRMGLIVSWLRSVPVTPEKLAEFYAWYKQQYEHASAPRDLEKFKGHYAAFIQSQVNPVRISNPAYIPIVDRPRMPVSELVSLDIVNAGRKAVPS